MQHLLRVERGEAPLRHDLGKHRKRLVAFEGSSALRGGKRRERARVEQRRLLGLDERDAHALPFRDRALNGSERVGPVQNGLPRKRGSLGRRLLPHEAQHVGQMRVEADALEGGRHARGVERGERRVLQVELEIDIARDGRHLPARKRLIAVGLDLLLLLAFELAGVLVDALEVAVGGKQLRGRLVAHAGHAGDVVGRVALKPEEIGELGGCDAIALEDLVGAVDRNVGDALLGRDDVGELAHELVDVLIAGHKQRAVPERLVARGHGAQDVVAFPASHAHNWDAHSFEQAFHQGKLYFKRVVHRGTLRLVLLNSLHAPLRAPRIEGAHDGIRMRHLHELQQHGDEAEARVGRRAVGRVHRGRNGVVGAVHERIAVDDGHGFRHGRPSRVAVFSANQCSTESTRAASSPTPLRVSRASRGERSYCSAMARQRSRKGDAFFGGSIEGGHSALAVMRASKASSVSESSAP